MPELDLDHLGTCEASATNAKRYRFVLVSSKAGVTAGSLENAPGFAGEGLIAAKILADQGGRATWDLAPERDAIAKKLDGLDASADVASFVIGFPGDDDASPTVVAGPTLARRALAVVHLELDIDPADPASADDTIKIVADDGSFEEVKSVKDDVVAGDDKTTLQFEVPSGKAYSVQVDPGKEGKPYWLHRSVTIRKSANQAS